MPNPLHALSALNAPLLHGFFGFFPFLLIVGGPALLFYLPFHRANVEERVKSRAMTEAEAQLHLRFLRVSGPALVVIGCAQIAIRLCAFSG